jgi:hypothetical protein
MGELKACHAAHHANEFSSRLCTALGRDKTTNSEIPGREIRHRCLLALVVGPLRPHDLNCKVDASLMLGESP